MNSNLKKHSSNTNKGPKGKTNRRLGTSIKKEGIHPRDYLNLDHRFSCEDCSHFQADQVSCTLGFKTEDHLKATQTKSYEMSGKIAFCRFLEID